TKMPEYFIENRTREFDLHKDLTPSMSTLVIKNHVKEGAELAHKLKLPRALREIIEQHHGNSLVRYFYAKAKQTYDPMEQTVGEESFRYPGPAPQTKEAGLVMLADSIEAASRSLKAPTKDNLKRVITDIINGTLQDGQLDACDFSLRELRTVAAAFLTVLYAIYHPRVEYPGFSFEGKPKSRNDAGSKNKKNHDHHPQPPEKTPGPDQGV
ncbi:MAG: HD domain-containing protein, partial [Candidatus Aminicenantales bacterium]